MKTTTYTDLRANLADHMDAVNADHAPLIVTRSGKPAVVMMSAEDFESWRVTARLTASPRNAEALREAIAELEAGGGRAIDRG